MKTIYKITSGSVVQTFRNGNLINQEFMAGDECRFENSDGEEVLATDDYAPFDMVQPYSNTSMNSWIEQLQPIIKEYGDNEPLDGDDVDRLVEIIRAKINLNQGNITDHEYNEILDFGYLQNSKKYKDQ